MQIQDKSMQCRSNTNTGKLMQLHPSIVSRQYKGNNNCFRQFLQAIQKQIFVQIQIKLQKEIHLQIQIKLQIQIHLQIHIELQIQIQL